MNNSVYKIEEKSKSIQNSSILQISPFFISIEDSNRKNTSISSEEKKISNLNYNSSSISNNLIEKRNQLILKGSKKQEEELENKEEMSKTKETYTLIK